MRSPLTVAERTYGSQLSSARSWLALEQGAGELRGGVSAARFTTDGATVDMGIVKMSASET
jgi:hypothetical protein